MAIRNDPKDAHEPDWNRTFYSQGLYVAPGRVYKFEDSQMDSRPTVAIVVDAVISPPDLPGSVGVGAVNVMLDATQCGQLAMSLIGMGWWNSEKETDIEFGDEFIAEFVHTLAHGDIHSDDHAGTTALDWLLHSIHSFTQAVTDAAKRDGLWKNDGFIMCRCYGQAYIEHRPVVHDPGCRNRPVAGAQMAQDGPTAPEETQ